jgi:hypothetical protein
MFNFFKTKQITIPKDNDQTVTEVESWTVEWISKDFDGYSSDRKHNAKVFINEANRNEFVKQLKECSKFINAEISITVKKN